MNISHNWRIGMLAGILAGGLLPGTVGVVSAATASAQESSLATMSDVFVLPGDPAITSSLHGLKIDGGAAEQLSKATYTLVYFGTAYRVGSCASDLLVIHHAIDLLANRCGAAAASRIQPVLVYPRGGMHDGAGTANIEAYVDTPDARFIALGGEERAVFALSARFGGYYRLNDNGLVGEHARRSYLMNSAGSNLAIFREGTPFGLMTDRLIAQLGQDGHLDAEVRHPNCRF